MSTEIAEKKYLKRSKNNSMIVGVCAGIADYFAIDVTIVRIAFVLFAVFGGSGILVYIILWIVLPESESVKLPDHNESPKTNTDNASNWIAFILVGLGVYFLLQNLGLTFSFFDFISFWDIVPVGLIVGGIYLFYKRR